MTDTTTWKPHKAPDGKLSSAAQKDLPDSVFAFPKQRKEPMTDASHVRNAISRFDQVKDVSEHEREQAFKNIKKAAAHFDIEMKEDHWHQLGKHPHTRNAAK